MDPTGIFWLFMRCVARIVTVNWNLYLPSSVTESESLGLFMCMYMRVYGLLPLLSL